MYGAATLGKTETTHEREMFPFSASGTRNINTQLLVLQSTIVYYLHLQLCVNFYVGGECGPISTNSNFNTYHSSIYLLQEHLCFLYLSEL